ncbi:unannotated protein [freshwater metagenome]|uniref:Unannotated protein n=1 Tax=freshwater metagenome TaxID=449393 RepID=A0A6J6RL73_9ZZZZ
MGNRCTHLTLDVIPNNGKTSIFKLSRPHRIGCDKDRKCIYEGASCIDCALCVVLSSLFRAHWQVTDEDIYFFRFERCYNIDRCCCRFLNCFLVILTKAIECDSAQNWNSSFGNFRKLDCVVLARPNSFREIKTDFLGIDIKCCNKLHIVDVISTNDCMHKSRYLLVNGCICVISDSLHE